MTARATLLAATWALARFERDGPACLCPVHVSDYDEQCDALSAIVVDTIPLALIERDWEALQSVTA